MTSTITTAQINAAISHTERFHPGVEAGFKANSNAYVLVASGQIAEAFGHIGLHSNPDQQRAARGIFERALARFTYAAPRAAGSPSLSA